MSATGYPFDAVDSGDSPDGPTTGDKLAEPTPIKIQVLYLPEEKAGDVSRYPFALVVSEMGEEPPPDEVATWQQFKDHVGAVAILLTPRKIEVV